MRTNPHAPTVLAVLLVALASAWGGDGKVATDPALATLTAAHLMKHETELAKAEYEGRGAGTPGAAKAARYLEKQLADAALAPKGTDGYQQPFKAGERTLKNLVGVLAGDDDDLAKEYVVIGAHYDHLGVKKGSMYPGADDDASGCAVVVEVARAFQAAGERPRRSVLFLAFDGEEMGLLGSKYFVAHPTVPKEQIVAMLNLDMVSRGDTAHLQVCGTATSKELKAIVEKEAPLAPIELRYEFEREWRRASDHGPFGDAGIPFLYFGVEDHEDYHKPSDTADKANTVKLERIARLAYLTLRAMADADERPSFTKQ